MIRMSLQGVYRMAEVLEFALQLHLLLGSRSNHLLPELVFKPMPIRFTLVGDLLFGNLGIPCCYFHIELVHVLLNMHFGDVSGLGLDLIEHFAQVAVGVALLAAAHVRFIYIYYLICIRRTLFRSDTSAFYQTLLLL